MKALSLWQPWATLIAIGAKRIETRSWPTNYRGPLAIHAARKWDSSLRHLSVGEPFLSALREGGITFKDRGFPDSATMPLGAIVATCDLVDCRVIPAKQTEIEVVYRTNGRQCVERLMIPPWKPLDPPGPKLEAARREFRFGDYRAGRFAWVLANVRKIDPPIECRGAQGFFDVDDSLIHPAPTASPNTSCAKFRGYRAMRNGKPVFVINSGTLKSGGPGLRILPMFRLGETAEWDRTPVTRYRYGDPIWVKAEEVTPVTSTSTAPPTEPAQADRPTRGEGQLFEISEEGMR